MKYFWSGFKAFILCLGVSLVADGYSSDIFWMKITGAALIGAYVGFSNERN